MGVGRWIGPGMTMGWHSFKPNPITPARVVFKGSTPTPTAKALEARELAGRARPIIRRRVVR